MDNLFALLVLTSFILLVIGIFKPKTSLFWDKNAATRNKSALIYGGLTVLFFTLFGITTDRKPKEKVEILSTEKQTTSNTNEQTKTETPVPTVKKPTIEKVKEKKEERADGDFNQMTLFFVDTAISIDDLSKYCLEHKNDYTNGYFQILVFFKNQKAIRFPDNPITATFMEEKDLKNIKAIYTLNNKNGYSKLDFYDNNAYESKSNSVDIK